MSACFDSLKNIARRQKIEYNYLFRELTTKFNENSKF